MLPASWHSAWVTDKVDAKPTTWTVTRPGDTVAAFVKASSGEPWSVVKKQLETGKIFVDGQRVIAVDYRVMPGQVVELKIRAPKPRDPTREAVIVWEDTHVVVIDKPSGISSVPYDEKETGTAMDLIRGAWKRQGKAATTVALHVVHRIDKGTSGLIMFAKNKRAEVGLAAQLRDHSCERTYLCVAHGDVAAARIESMLVTDRGDGIRGSTRHANQGKRAITHVAPVEKLRGATLCEVKLETGKTHQIRIHLAERGHPLVGEEVYIRDFSGSQIPSDRLMLHAATLGFAHPISGEPVRLSAALPEDFLRIADRLKR